MTIMFTFRRNDPLKLLVQVSNQTTRWFNQVSHKHFLQPGASAITRVGTVLLLGSLTAARLSMRLLDH